MNSIEKNIELREKFKAVPINAVGEKEIEKTKLAVFDFDETLVQSQDMFYQLMITAAERLGLICDDVIVKKIFAKWDKEYFGWGKDLEEQKVIYESKYQPMVTKLSNDPFFLNQMIFFDGMKYVIRVLARTDIALAIASSRDVLSILTFLKKEGMKDYFSIIEATEGGKNFEDKPNISIVSYISQEMGIPLEKSVMIGDSPSDIKMGKNAGMKTIAAGYGKYSSEEKLKKENPDVVIGKKDKPLSIVFAIKDLLDTKTYS